MRLGSTDMGNVSHAVPTLHPMIRIADLDVPEPLDRFREGLGIDPKVAQR